MIAEPADLVEARLRQRLAAGDESVELLDALCAALVAQTKPVPPDIEERTLRAHLALAPERYDLAFRLGTLLMAQAKELPPNIEEKALRHALTLAPGRLDLMDRLGTVIYQQVMPRRASASSMSADDGLLLARAREHMATGLAAPGSLPPFGARWSTYVERMREAIGAFSSSTEAILYAQRQVGFEHRRPAAEQVRFFPLYERELRLEFPQYADLLSEFHDFDGADPESVLDNDGRLLSNVTYYHARNVMLGLSCVARPDVVMEIGGGFGLPALTWLTNPIHRPRQYVIIDIPESLFFSELMLERAFPGRVCYLTPDRAVTDAEAREAAVVLCPVGNLNAVGSLSADLVVNTGSLQEMSEDWIDLYMDWLDRQPVQYFFSLNYAVQPLSFLAESVNLWSPRLSPRWKAILLRWNSPFIRMQGDRNFLEAVYEKTDEPLPASAVREAMARLSERRLTGEVVVEALELIRRSLSPDLMLTLMRRIRDELAFLPKEALWLTSWLTANGSADFLERNGTEIAAFDASLREARARGVEGTV
jgi:putative sugar O-methyltransferase